MASSTRLQRVPGLAATVLMIVLATAAAITGTSSLFYEAWGQPVTNMLGYLVPATALMALGLIAVRWPSAGAAALACTGLLTVGWWAFGRWRLGMGSPEAVAQNAAVLIAPIVLIAGLFFWEARIAGAGGATGGRSRGGWLGRHWRWAFIMIGPLLGAGILAARQVPVLLARYDDGLRGARSVTAGGARLTWAPLGPGWNAAEATGDYPSWAVLNRYGRLPEDRCAYLDAAGTALSESPGRVWRLPTVDELVGSLTRGGRPAGCVWDGRSPHASCREEPDKETPLWAPDQPPIYYWSSQEASAATVFAVNYTGGISVLPKTLRGIGFRCVRAEH